MRRHAGLGLAPLLLACTAGPQACTTVTQAPPVVSGVGTAHPPADPGGPPPDPSAAGDVAVFAIRHLRVGDVDPQTGQASTTAWQSVGMDIDGKNTPQHATDVCTLAPGAAPQTAQDGPGGVDNSFGQNIVPILEVTAGQQSFPPLDQGTGEVLMTNLLIVHGLGSATTASPLSASLVVAAPFPGTPSWSPADAWPVDASSLLGGDLASPLLAFAGAYVTDGVFVAEPASGAGEIGIGVIGRQPFVFPIRHVQVQMTLSADGSTATSGVISGVIPGDRLAELGQRVAARVSASECDASVYRYVGDELLQAQDILLDGTNEPGQACNGISFGVEFDAVRVSLGPAVAASPMGDLCLEADGGS